MKEVENMNDEQSKKINDVAENPWVKNLLFPLMYTVIGAIVGAAASYILTQRQVQETVTSTIVGEISEILPTVSSDDSLKKALEEVETLQNNLSLKAEEINSLNAKINELSDTSEYEKLNTAYKKLETEKEKLEGTIKSLQEELTTKQAEIDHIVTLSAQEILDSYKSAPVSLFSANVDVLREDLILTNCGGCLDANKAEFSNHLRAKKYGTAYIEYDLNDNYAFFDGTVFVTRDAASSIADDDNVWNKVSFQFEAKYGSNDEYHLLASEAGFSRFDEGRKLHIPIEGVTAFKITIMDGNTSYYDECSLIGLGDPTFYKISTD